MIRPATLAAAAVLALAMPAAAQEVSQICFSVGGTALETAVALYGADGTLVELSIPPATSDAATETRVATIAPGTVPAMAEVLAPAIPTLPVVEECATNDRADVTFALGFTDAAPLIYRAPCISPEVLALNSAIIEASGDPMGQETARWSVATIPDLRDICTRLP